MILSILSQLRVLTPTLTRIKAFLKKGFSYQLFFSFLNVLKWLRTVRSFLIREKKKLCNTFPCFREGSSLALFFVQSSNLLCSYISAVQFSSVAQPCLTLRPHESQHTRPPSPSPTPRVHSDSRPLSQWCHLTINREPCLCWFSNSVMS